MEERALRSRVNWVVGLVLATAFVGTTVYSVLQDSDDGGHRADRRSDEPVVRETEAVLVPEVAPPLEVPMGPADLPEATLTVHTDGCGVIRSDVPDGTDLTWVVKDRDGFQVLGRVAEHEDRYRYYRPGTYTVVLESMGEEISNTVTIRC